MRQNHLLLLAGSGEGRRIAEALAAETRPGWKITGSLMHVPRAAGPLPVPARLGGFGGDAGFRAFLSDENVTAVLDATHPFAARISARSAAICREMAIPYAQVLRPCWTPQAGDVWVLVKDETMAASYLGPGQRVFTTIGQRTLPDLATATTAHLFVRRLSDTPPGNNWSNVTYVPGTGPFSVDEELAILRELNIDMLVVKNSGGAPSRTKLDAARALGLPVILIDRPPQPDARRLETVQDALDWVDAL